MSGRHELHHAIKRTAKHQAIKHQSVRRASVSKLSPLTINMFGFGHPLTLANDFDLSGWMMLFQSVVGLRVGDLVLVSHEDAIVVFDVVTDSDVAGIFDAWDTAKGPS